LKSYVCTECGADLEKEDLKEGLEIGTRIVLLCPCCDEWIMIEVKKDE